MKALSLFAVALGLVALARPSPLSGSAGPAVQETPFLTSELVFPLEHWHNHASMIVEAPNSDLIVDWFHGLRRADRGRCRRPRGAAEEGHQGMERAVPARRHAGLSRHERHDVHRSAAAAVAAVADDPGQ